MMKPEKFIGIMLLTLLLSCEMEEQQAENWSNTSEKKVGKVSFETNQYMMSSAFEIDIYIDGKKVKKNNQSSTIIFSKELVAGIHSYEVKVYTFNGQPGKSIKGRFMVQENKTSEVFVDFKEYNSWK